ncbi:MAG: hypothetical protein ACLTON_00280 [Christensenellales bacterium]|jgi:hypothetical protein
MKEFFKNVIAILFLMFTFCLIIFTCVNTENGNFEILPSCFAIMFLILAITVTIAKHNDRKEKQEKRERKNQLYRKKIEQRKKAELLANQDEVMKFATSELSYSEPLKESKVDKSQQDFLKKANIAILAYQEALHKNTSHN